VAQAPRRTLLLAPGPPDPSVYEQACRALLEAVRQAGCAAARAVPLDNQVCGGCITVLLVVDKKTAPATRAALIPPRRH